jgi:two-component system NarL family sensor kinase
VLVVEEQASGRAGAYGGAETEHDRLVRLNRELSVLNAIAEGLNRSVDLREALQRALVLVTELLGLRAGWVWLVDEETGEPELVAAQALPPVLRDEPNRMTSMCLCLRTFIRGDLTGAANINVLECSRLWGLDRGTEGLLHHASIPLYSGQRRLGVMNVAAPDWRRLDADELELLHTIGYQMGIAVERARLHARAAQTATVEERLRLARELHDSLAQSITGVGLQLEAADALFDRSPDAARARLHEALRQTRVALEEMRTVVRDLRTGTLESKPLPESLRELGARDTELYGLDVQVTCAGHGGRLAPVLESNLFRIAQEALTNTAKHASAQHAWVRLEVGDEVVTLTVEDDGCGFDPEFLGVRSRERAQHGYGIGGIQERTRLLGGRQTLISAPGQGTEIQVVIPLDREPR